VVTRSDGSWLRTADVGDSTSAPPCQAVTIPPRYPCEGTARPSLQITARFVASSVFPPNSWGRQVCGWVTRRTGRQEGLIMDMIRTRYIPPPPTPESIERARTAMYLERIAHDFCPACEPVRSLDQFGYCPNLACRFSEFGSPSPIPGDPRR
jgi:hypothetical protein